ncbi:MAG: hypothetical protein HONBIEJF_01838 [Fimbriimonadaceae bacterium]|nr:hypothetical protein [Fimbriimonadaceae bacterium]
MRALIYGCLAFVPVAASADRLITIPTGSKILFRNMKVESFFLPSESNRSLTYFGYGIDRSFDAEIVIDRLSQRKVRGTFNFSWNYVPAVVDVSPGITIGIRDGLDQTGEGRSVYLATSNRFFLDGDFNSDLYGELIMGFGIGGFRGAFTGLSLPVSSQFRLVAEYDSRRITAGLDYRPDKAIQLRLLVRDGSPFLGLTLTRRF